MPTRPIVDEPSSIEIIPGERWGFWIELHYGVFISREGWWRPTWKSARRKGERILEKHRRRSARARGYAEVLAGHEADWDRQFEALNGAPVRSRRGRGRFIDSQPPTTAELRYPRPR